MRSSADCYLKSEERLDTVSVEFSIAGGWCHHSAGCRTNQLHLYNGELAGFTFLIAVRAGEGFGMAVSARQARVPDL